MVLTKIHFLLGHCLLSLLARGHRLFFFLEIFLKNLPIGDSMLEDSATPCLGNMRGNKETQGKDWYAVHQDCP